MKLSGNHFKIFQAIMDAGEAGLNGKAIAAATGISRSSIYVHLGRMADQKWLVSEERPGPNGPPLVFYKVTGLGQRAHAYEVARRRCLDGTPTLGTV